MNNIGEALGWISGLLQKHHIPFQITGGLAAHAYGATRPINDIDIDIPEEDFPKLLKDVQEFIVDKPDRYKNEVWDVWVMTLNYYGQEIDIGGAYTTKVKDTSTNIWHDVKADFNTSTYKNLFGIDVPVVNKRDFIRYKTYLASSADHQKQDVAQIQ